MPCRCQQGCEAGAQGHGSGGGEASAKGSGSRSCEATPSTSHHCASSASHHCASSTSHRANCTNICSTHHICSTNHFWHCVFGRSDSCWRLWSPNHRNQLRNRPLSGL